MLTTLIYFCCETVAREYAGFYYYEEQEHPRTMTSIVDGSDEAIYYEGESSVG